MKKKDKVTISSFGHTYPFAGYMRSIFFSDLDLEHLANIGYKRADFDNYEVADKIIWEIYHVDKATTGFGRDIITKDYPIGVVLINRKKKLLTEVLGKYLTLIHSSTKLYKLLL